VNGPYGEIIAHETLYPTLPTAQLINSSMGKNVPVRTKHARLKRDLFFPAFAFSGSFQNGLFADVCRY